MRCTRLGENIVETCDQWPAKKIFCLYWPVTQFYSALARFELIFGRQFRSESGKLFPMRRAPPGERIVRELDEIDYKILRQLQFNARVTNTVLADQIALSPSPCWNRVKRLETDGVIEKYVTVISQRALGVPDSVILEMKVSQHDEETLKRFEEALRRFPEVIEAFLVTGEYDYYIRVATSGTDGYEKFLREIYKLPGVSHTRSSFVLRCLKQTYSVQPRQP